MMVVFASLCFNFNILLPVLAKQTLDAGPRTFGDPLGAFGAGALHRCARCRGARTRPLAHDADRRGRLRGLRAADRARPVGAARRACSSSSAGSSSRRTRRTRTPACSSTRPITCAAACSSLYYYAWNGLAPLGGLIVGWLSATGGTELAFTVAGTAGLVMATSGTLVLRQKKAPPIEEEPAEPGEQLIAA